MLQFEHSSYFWLILLLAIPIFLFLRNEKWKQKIIARLGRPEITRHQFYGLIKNSSKIKLAMVISALALLTFSLMNLRKGSGTEQTDRKGLDVMIALDVSKSMLAKDVSPDRLQRAKTLINQLLSQTQNDRVGLVVFAGKAYLQSPLTIDYNALKLLLNSTSPDMIPTQGTVLGDAINMANQSFNSTQKKYKVVVLISDGEDHDETAISATKSAADDGVIIYTIGVGSPEGAQILDKNGEVKKDNEGNIVISKLNEDELKSIAEAGKGNYQLLYNTGKVANKLAADINGLEKRNQGAVVFTQYKSYFQIFVGLSLLLLLIEGFIPKAKNISLYKK